MHERMVRMSTVFWTKHMVPHSRIIRGVRCVGLLLALLLVTGCGASRSTSSASPTQTLTVPTQIPMVPTQIPTVQPELPAPWHELGAAALAFVPGDPQTLYACGDANPASSPLNVDVSHDAGKTWYILASLPAGTDCRLRINPYQPQTMALVLEHTPCTQGVCESGPANQCFRSTNGGKTWTELKSPLNQGAFMGDLTWTPQSLFADIAEPQQSGSSRPTVDIVASVQGAPFTIVSPNHGLAGQPIAELRQFGSVGATVLVGFDPPGVSSIIYPAVVVVQSSDNGATWVTAHLQNQGNPVGFLATSYDGKWVIGRFAPQQIAASNNGGATWTPTPPYPSDLTFIADFATVTPTGTVFAVLANRTGGGATRKLCRFTPGTSTWQVVQDLTPYGQNPAIVSVTWDAQGHQQAVWATVGQFPSHYYWLTL